MKKLIVAVSLAAFAAAANGEDPVTMRSVAHRGMWSKNLPQNTVEAIKLAYDSGATWVETDFHHTKAGQMVCIDAAKELKQYTSCTKQIRDLTPDDVATINLGEKAGLAKTYRIPLLDQVLAVVPKTCVLQSEIKGYSPQYADIFDAAVKAAGLSETNIVVSSFNYDALKDMKARYPKYRTTWLFKESYSEQFDVQKAIAKCKAAKIDAFCPYVARFGSSDGACAAADAVRAAGIEFRVFGMNSKEDLVHAKKLKVAGFTTNHWKASFEWAKSIGGIALLK